MSGSLVIKKKTLIYYSLFFVLLIAPFITSYISAFSFVDELITIIGIGVLFNNYYFKKYISGRKVLFFLIVMVLIGILSSIVYRISPSVDVTLYDLVLFVKPFVLFLMFYTISTEIKKEILSGLNIFAKIGFLYTFVYFVLHTLFGFFFMSDVFPILGNMAQVSWLRVVCLNIIVATNEKKVIKRYIVLFYISLFVHGIGGFASALFASLTLYLYLYRENKERKLHIWQIVLLVCMALIFAYGDLQEYILDGNAPRALLLQYGFVTANRYFPLGSGFASYGSEMAKRYYSKLYYEYGFDKIWSMSPENNLSGSEVGTLNDCYLGMIVGQYGWIGLCCYVGIIYSIYKMLTKGLGNTYSKAVSISTLITILSSVMVSNNTSSHFGICMYAVMGLVSFSCVSRSKTIKGKT